MEEKKNHILIKDEPESTSVYIFLQFRRIDEHFQTLFQVQKVHVKKNNLKSCTNFSLRVLITIKMLGTGFEPFPPVLSPNKVAASKVCLYMFIQIDLQNRWSRLSHLCLHNFYQKTFNRKFPRGLIHQIEHTIIVNFSPISPTVFLQQI